jgi:hypothetical protein
MVSQVLADGVFRLLDSPESPTRPYCTPLEKVVFVRGSDYQDAPGVAVRNVQR